MRGILLDENNDLHVRVRRDAQGKITGGFLLGENAVQCAGLVLQMNQGELKSDPIVGKVVVHDGIKYRIVQPHTSQSNWLPSNTLSLYSSFTTADVVLSQRDIRRICAKIWLAYQIVHAY